MLCMLINNDLLHRGFENQLSPVYSSLSLSLFLSLHFSTKVSSHLYKIESSYLVYKITRQVGLWDREPALFCLILSVFVHFFSLCIQY